MTEEQAEAMPFTFGSLFAGIGGIDLGLERAGMACRWQVEIDSFCRRVLAKHWPDVRRYEDVRDCGRHNLETVDLICGGFPCQPHSNAGKRRGAEDDRNLWPEFLRVIAEVRPAWILAENVPGIVSLYLDTVLSNLESAGYTCWPFNIPACAFNAPHRRYRIFVVAYAPQLFSDGGDDNARECMERQSLPQLGNSGGPEDVAHAEKQRAGDERKNIRQASGEVNTLDNASCLSRGANQSNDGADVADTVCQRCDGWTGLQKTSRPPGEFSFERDNPWGIEPSVGRVAYGIPNRVDRLRALGNAVVPQIAEWIGRQILEVNGNSDD